MIGVYKLYTFPAGFCCILGAYEIKVHGENVVMQIDQTKPSVNPLECPGCRMIPCKCSRGAGGDTEEKHKKTSAAGHAEVEPTPNQTGSITLNPNHLFYSDAENLWSVELNMMQVQPKPSSGVNTNVDVEQDEQEDGLETVMACGT